MLINGNKMDKKHRKIKQLFYIYDSFS